MNKYFAVFVLAAVISLAAGCGKAPVASTPSAAAAQPVRGGQAVVLLGAEFAGSWPAGLDPATNFMGGGNISMMNAIFGGLFQLTADDDGRNARVTGVLAESYSVEDEGRSLVIHLRPDVVFSDGTPFDAEAVKFNIERDLSTPCPCSPASWPWADHDRVVARDARTVLLNFSRPYAPAINSLPGSNINWIVSPSSLQKMGEAQFKLAPVGAGPFKVVSDQLSSKLALERNPTYWQQGRPYLDRLVFQSIGSEQAAFQALQAGDAQVFEGMSSPVFIQQARQDPSLTVTEHPATSSLVVQLNTATAPFNDLKAREAIYYATDVDAIRRGVFDESYPHAQSFTSPGGLFYHATVSRYRSYDLGKATQIVKSLGGLKLTLHAIKNFTNDRIITALQTQWQKANIEVAIETIDLGTMLKKFSGKDWQAMLQTAGSYDPEVGSGLRTRFRADGVFSGVHDAQLDKLIAAGMSTFDPAARDAVYLQASEYISDNAYAPFLVPFSPATLSRGAFGPGLTTKIPPVQLTTAILWQDAWVAR